MAGFHFGTGFWNPRNQQSFFFDTFTANPELVFACRKLTSNAGPAAFDIHDSSNVYIATVYWNNDGSLTSASITNDLTHPTLGDLLLDGHDRPIKWYEQMSGGSEFAIAANVNTAIAIDTNGNAYVAPGNTSIVYTTNSQHNIPQPLTVVCNMQSNGANSVFKTAWTLYAVDDTTVNARHQSIRLTGFGSVTFGTLRSITDDIYTSPTVVQYTGDGTSGNVWVNNIPKTPASMGTNGSLGVIRFGLQVSLIHSEFIVFPSGLTTAERTDLYNELNGFYVL